MIKKIESVKDFDKMALSKESFILKFESESCAPCKQLNVLLKSLDSDRLMICTVDVEGKPGAELSSKYSVRSLPTMIYFKSGELETVITGLEPTQTRLMIKNFKK